jgi:hypothetical protein
MGWRLYLVLIAVCGPAASVGAYPTPVDFDGSILRWDIELGSAPITYHIDANHEGDDALYGPIIDDAAALWSNVPNSYFRFTPAVPGDTPQVTIYLQNAIEGGTYSAGYAIFDGYEGKTPTHCSIYVAVTGNESMDGLAKTFLHELGHCAGLGHSLIPEAIMSYELDKNRFALDIDDEAAITRLYPADGSKPSLPPGCAVGAATTSGSAAWWLCLPFLVAVYRHARRVRRPL